MHLLIALDDTAHSQQTIDMAAVLAAQTPCRVTLLTVARRLEQREAGEQILAAANERLATAVSTRHTLLRFGQPAERILETVENAPYDLLLMGQRPEYGVLPRLRGSTLARVLAAAPCPLLVAKGRIRPLRRVLLCEAGAQPTLLERLMQRLAPLLHPRATFCVLHVMSQISAGPGVAGWPLRAPAEQLIAAHTDEGELLQQDVQRLQAAQVDTHPVVRHGFVVDEILAEAERGAYDLAIIGAHHPGGWEKLLLADNAQQLVARLACPVLVLR